MAKTEYQPPVGFAVVSARACGCAGSWKWGAQDHMELHYRVCHQHQQEATDRASVEHVLGDLPPESWK